MRFGIICPTQAFTASYTGLKNNETTSVVSGLSFSTLATLLSPLGRYAITLSGASAQNYAISFIDGTLTVGIPDVSTFPDSVVHEMESPSLLDENDFQESANPTEFRDAIFPDAFTHLKNRRRKLLTIDPKLVRAFDLKDYTDWF